MTKSVTIPLTVAKALCTELEAAAGVNHLKIKPVLQKYGLVPEAAPKQKVKPGKPERLAEHQTHELSQADFDARREDKTGIVDRMKQKLGMM